MASERLQKLMAAAGIASRRASETLILEGRVTVNGRTVTALGTKADPDRDEIRVDGRRVRTTVRLRYILLNKPRGYITSRADPQRRPTVMDLLRERGEAEAVYPVGRLDYDSEGLLLLTNDGDLAARLTHPRHEVEREYEVQVRGVPGRHEIERLSRGVTVEGRRTAPAKARLNKTFETPAGAQAIVLLAIHEGRNRQVRKMCEAIGHPVVRLRRVRIGPITAARLKPGEFRELTPGEVAALKRTAARQPGRKATEFTRPAAAPRTAPAARFRSRSADGPRRRA